MSCKSCDAPIQTAIVQDEAVEVVDNPSTLTANAPCRWCGKPIIHSQAWICGECDKPRRFPGYLSFIATTLLLPLVLVLATYSLNSEQQRIANRQKLADAYVAFGTTMTDYRRAAATFDVLTKSANNGRVSLSETKKALLDFDAAFNAIGSKLGPFEETVRRSNEHGAVGNFTRWISGGKTVMLSKATREISLTWNNCFVAPYYGTSAVPTKISYWYRMHDLLKLCNANSCPRIVAERISQILSDVWTGTCVCGEPEQHRPLHWVYPVIQSLMEERDVAEIWKHAARL